jgi:hypothetical protein
MPGIFVQTAIFAALQTEGGPGGGPAERDLTASARSRWRDRPCSQGGRPPTRFRSRSDRADVPLASLLGFRFHTNVGYALLAFGLAIAVGYSFTWVATFTGLSLKSVEAVQAACSRSCSPSSS